MITPERISVEEVKEKMDKKESIFFIDTRNAQAWGSSDVKLPGALRIHYSELEQHLDEIPRDRLIVAYCTWSHEASSIRAVQILRDNGYESVSALEGGFDAWIEAGYPVEPK